MSQKPKRGPRQRKPRFLFLKYLVGFSALAMGVYCVWVYVDFERVAQRADAKVVDLRNETHAAGKRGGRVVITRPVVEFDVARPQGTLHVKAMAKTTSREADLVRGQRIEVAFDPGNPDETVRIDTGLSVIEIGTLLFGMLLVGYAMKEQLQWRRARTEGNTHGGVGAGNGGNGGNGGNEAREVRVT